MFKFEKVKRFDNIDIEAPVRKTTNSAAYDMVAAEDIIIMPMGRSLDTLNSIVVGNKIDDNIRGIVEKMVADGQRDAAQHMLDVVLTLTTDEVAALTKATGCKPSLIPTGYKAYMPENYSLDLYVRSSSPLKYWLILANSTGVIDGDYVDNPDNEGEIFFQVINLLPFPIKIKKGEIIGQGKFVRFEKTDDDHLQEKNERLGGLGSTSENQNQNQEEEIVE